MITSTCRVSSSSTVSESHCPWYVHSTFGTSLTSSGQLAMISSARAKVVGYLEL